MRSDEATVTRFMSAPSYSWTQPCITVHGSRTDARRAPPQPGRAAQILAGGETTGTAREKTNPPRQGRRNRTTRDSRAPAGARPVVCRHSGGFRFARPPAKPERCGSRQARLRNTGFPACAAGCWALGACIPLVECAPERVTASRPIPPTGWEACAPLAPPPPTASPRLISSKPPACPAARTMHAIRAGARWEDFK